MQVAEYLSVIRSRRWLIVWTIAIVTVGAVVASMFQTPMYQGKATLLYVQRNPGTAIIGVAQPEITNFPDIELGTQVGLIQQPEIAQMAITRLRLVITPKKLLERLTVTADGQAKMITVAAVAATPKDAALLADAIADAYTTWSRDANRRSIDAAAAEVQRSLDATARQIAALEASAAAGPAAANDARLRAANTRYGTLSDQLQQLQLARDLETGSVSLVTHAVQDPDPVSPKPVRNGALGLAVGLMLGLGMAFVANTLDSTVKSGDEVAELYGTPLLGQVPLDHPGKGESTQPAVLARPTGPVAESYRGLRNNLEFVNFDRSIKTLLVTSAVPGEGKSTVTANIAVVLAQAGWRVAVVVVDFRRSAAEEPFGLQRSPGLSEVLAGTSSLASAIRRPLDGLLLLPSGKTPPNPSELLGSTVMKDVIAELGESADIIIVDAPPLLAVADAAATAIWTDAALVVTRDGLTTREEVRKAREQLDRVGGRVIGVVFTGAKESRGARGGYDMYSAYYGPDVPTRP